MVRIVENSIEWGGVCRAKVLANEAGCYKITILTGQLPSHSKYRLYAFYIIGLGAGKFGLTWSSVAKEK